MYGVFKVPALNHLKKLYEKGKGNYSANELIEYLNPAITSTLGMYSTIAFVGTLLVSVSAPLCMLSLENSSAQEYSFNTNFTIEMAYRCFTALAVYFSVSATFMATINYMVLAFWLTEPEEKLWFLFNYNVGVLVNSVTFAFLSLICALPLYVFRMYGLTQSIPLIVVAGFFFLYDFCKFYSFGILVDIGLKQFDGCRHVVSSQKEVGKCH